MTYKAKTKLLSDGTYRGWVEDGTGYPCRVEYGFLNRGTAFRWACRERDRELRQQQYRLKRERALASQTALSV